MGGLFRLRWAGPELENASIKTLGEYRIICDGTGIEWEALYYQLSVESMLAEHPLAIAA